MTSKLLGPHLLMILLIFSGCQSKADALKIVCDAPLNPKVRNAPPELKISTMTKYIDSELSNSEIKNLISAFGDLDPASRQKRMKEILKTEGIVECAIVDALAPIEPKI